MKSLSNFKILFRYFKRNKLAISNNLYIMCENVTKIMNYFNLGVSGLDGSFPKYDINLSL